MANKTVMVNTSILIDFYRQIIAIDKAVAINSILKRKRKQIGIAGLLCVMPQMEKFSRKKSLEFCKL